MVKSLKNVIIALIVVFSALTLTFAAEDFSVSVDNNTDSIIQTQTASFVVTINNNGTESLNLTYNNTLVLTSGSNTVNTSVNKQSAQNLANGSSDSFTISTDAFAEIGTYTGTLNVESSNGLTRSIDLTVNVADGRSISTPTISVSTSNPTVGEDVVMSVRVSNDGTVALNNLSVDVSIDSLSLTQSYTISSLGTGSSNSESVTFSIPTTASAGTTIVSVEVDYDDSTSAGSSNTSFTLIPSNTIYFDGFEDGTISIDVDLDETDDSKRLTLVNAYSTEIDDIIFRLTNDIGDFELERHIEFEDGDGDSLDVDEDDKDEEYEIPGGGSYSLKLLFDNLDEIPVEVHSASNVLSVQYRVTIDGSQEVITERFNLELDADKEEVDVKFDAEEYIFELKRGDEEDFTISIDNNEEFEVNNLTFVIGDSFDLSTDSSEDLSDSRFTFEESGRFSLDEGTEKFDITIESNDNDEVGTYDGTFVLEYKNDEIDEIPVTLKITDGVYIRSITPKSDAIPGEFLDVEIVIENDESTQSISLDGLIANVNSIGTDLQDTENIIISKGETEVVTLSFKIPDDVKDSDLLLQVSMEYIDPEDNDDTITFIEEETIDVNRPDNSIEIRSAFVSPNVISCNTQVAQAKVSFRNSGSNIEDVDAQVKVDGTSISSPITSFELRENGEDSYTYQMPVSNLDAGSYDAEFVLTYNGGEDSRSQKVNFVVESCDSNGNSNSANNGGDIIIGGGNNNGGSGSDSNTDSNNDNDSSDDSDNNVSLFSNVDPLTIILVVIVGILLLITIVIAAIVL